MFAFFRVMPFRTRRFYFVLLLYFRSSNNTVLLLRLAEVGSPSVLQRIIKYWEPSASSFCNPVRWTLILFFKEKKSYDHACKGFVHMKLYRGKAHLLHFFPAVPPLCINRKHKALSYTVQRVSRNRIQFHFMTYTKCIQELLLHMYFRIIVTT